MNYRMKGMKTGVLVIVLMMMAVFIGCNDRFTEGIDAEEALAIDIEDMENYLSENGFTSYDTLENEIRALILDSGDGSSIEYEDIVEFDYIGRLTDGHIFDTSIPRLAFEQDTAHTDTLAFELDSNDEFVLDVNGFPTIEYAEFEEGYVTAYSDSRVYESSITTHTPGGWFIKSEGGVVSGYATGTHYILENVNLNGSGLMLLPRSVGSSGLSQNFLFAYGLQAIIFEIRPKEVK